MNNGKSLLQPRIEKLFQLLQGLGSTPPNRVAVGNQRNVLLRPMVGKWRRLEEMLAQAHCLHKLVNQNRMITLAINLGKVGSNPPKEGIQRTHHLGELIIIFFNRIQKTLKDIRHGALDPTPAGNERCLHG